MYAKRAWDLIHTFGEFNKTFIHREGNHREKSLVISSSMFNLDDLGNENLFKVKTLFRPTIANSEYSLQVFEIDEKLFVFCVNYKVEKEKNECLEPKDELNYFDQEGILNLKNN